MYLITPQRRLHYGNPFHNNFRARALHKRVRKLVSSPYHSYSMAMYMIPFYVYASSIHRYFEIQRAREW